MKKIVLLVLLLAATETVFAAELPSDLPVSGIKVFTAGEVTVSGKKDHAKETVAATEMEMLDKKNIAQAVNMLPGINVSNVGGRNEGMVYVRGFDMRQVPLYLDGIPLYVPYDGYIDPNRFTTFDLSEINVSKGFTSVLYGPNTLGGAINMVSRKPAERFEGSLKGGLTFSDEGLASEFASLNLGSNQGTWYVQGSLSILDRDFMQLSDSFLATKSEDGSKRDNSDSRDFRGSLKVGYTPNSTDEYSLSIISQQSSKGVPVYTGINPTQTVRYWRYGDWDKSSIYFIGKKALGSKSYLKARAYYDNYYNTCRAMTTLPTPRKRPKKRFQAVMMIKPLAVPSSLVRKS